ncbi:MAG: hypothetical protein AAFQ14_02855 [Cyanobacteria bacterium J06621_12]
MNYSRFYTEIYESHDHEYFAQKIKCEKLLALLRGIISEQSPKQIGVQMSLTHGHVRGSLTKLYEELENSFELIFEERKSKYPQVKLWGDKYRKKICPKLNEILVETDVSLGLEGKKIEIDVDELKSLLLQKLSESQKLPPGELDKLKKNLEFVDGWNQAGNFTEALGGYINLFYKKFPDFFQVFVKITCVLENLGQFKEEFSLASFAEPLAEVPEHKVILNNLIAGIIQDRAIANEDEELASQAASRYQYAHEISLASDTLDLIPLWNKTDLALSLWYKIDKIFYLDDAILSWKLLANLAKDKTKNHQREWKEILRKDINKHIDIISNLINILKQKENQDCLKLEKLSFLLKEFTSFIN